MRDAVCGEVLRVDRYFDHCYFVELERRDDNQIAIMQVMDWYDFDDVYGLGDPAEDMRPLHAAYAVMRAHKEDIVILRDCQHDGRKVRHHPDYHKPLEVELLCVSCHRKAHSGKTRKDFNGVFRQAAPQRNESQEAV